MPPQMALISMSLIVTRPVRGASESCMALTEPLDVCVVNAAHKAEGSAPKRTSLPSISAMSCEVEENPSDQMANPADTTDMVNIVPHTNPANFRRPVSPPIMNKIGRAHV